MIRQIIVNFERTPKGEKVSARATFTKAGPMTGGSPKSATADVSASDVAGVMKRVSELAVRADG